MASLDEIRESANAKYGALEIEVGDKVVVLRNVLRLPKADREKLRGLQEKIIGEKSEDGKRIPDPDVDQAELFRDVITLVCSSKSDAKVLLSAVGDDLAVLAEIFYEYNKATKVGEAQPSHE